MTRLLLLTPLMATAAQPLWQPLPPVPDAEGFAAPFVGVSHGALILAGGANMPEDKWAAAPRKVWYDRSYVLTDSPAKWQSAATLHRPLGYGVSVTFDERVLCFGGSDAMQHYAEGFALEWKDGQLHHTSLPSLPAPCANAAAAMVGHCLYIAGGIASPQATTAMHTFWRLDLKAKTLAWEELPAWPGEPRMLAVTASDDQAFYLFSGASLHAGDDGKAVRTYLRDAYRFDPKKGWQKLADPPRAAVAAPSPALHSGDTITIFSGDDGTKVDFQPVREHPGFPRDALAYDIARDAWSVSAEPVPFSRATATTTMWQGKHVIPNGEVRPRVRTPEVWAR